jgi:hypothetical protein
VSNGQRDDLIRELWRRADECDRQAALHVVGGNSEVGLVNQAYAYRTAARLINQAVGFEPERRP